MKICFGSVFFITGLLVGGFAVSEESATVDERFAIVGDTTLSRQDYDVALSQTIRSRYYHGSIPQAELTSIRQQVADDLIDRTLLLAEARRREVSVDEQLIQATLDQYEHRYADNPRWESQKDVMLAKLDRSLREEQLVSKLEETVRRSPPPTRAQLISFYDEHPEAFTEPVRMRVSLILLAVDPSSPSSAWDDAFVEASELAGQLKRGADFAELARAHSADMSAEKGGDMGYLHRGMLADDAQQALDAAQPGSVTDPVRVLEGVAIFQLVERTEPNLRDFIDVRQRVQELWLRQTGDRAWADLIDQLRESTVITMFEAPETVQGV